MIQKSGVSAQTANTLDNNLSIIGTMGGMSYLRASQVTALPQFKMPASTSTVLQGIGEIKESALAISNVRVAIQDLKMLNRKPLVETSQLTPKSSFGNKTQREVKQLLEDKFGPPKSVRNYAETYYNQKTQRSFNVHKEPGHNEGKAHADIRRRGGHQERKYDLFEDL